MAVKDPMFRPYATIHWCPADVKNLHPEWSDDKCMDVLSSVAGWLEARSIELGWEVLEGLVSDYEYEEDEDEDEV